MNLNKKAGYYEEVCFNDLSDKCQNFLLKDTITKTEKQCDLNIKIIHELIYIINEIENIFEVFFIKNRNLYNRETIFYENVPDSMKEIIEKIHEIKIYNLRTNLHTYSKTNLPMIMDKDFEEYIETIELQLNDLKSIKQQIYTSNIPDSDFKILKNILKNNVKKDKQ